MNYRILFVVTVLSPIPPQAFGQPARSPEVLDKRMSLRLVTKEPQIVTPVGLTFDHEGRLLVIESHTHFPPQDYPGPDSDRIQMIQFGEQDQIQLSTFLSGTHKTMSMRKGPDGWIYIATRMRVFRTRDSNGDNRADESEVIATLKTSGQYPHNGLCGLCFDANGDLWFGLGENLGESYELVGSDRTQLRGGGEGGNIYSCRPDGSKLRQVATGFWNPFGICTDTAGRIFTVGNDPDSSPPCRLVHVVRGGDYGYQFRYGRSGKHPLQAWDGELPGTLPMVAGTSEAPSSVLLWHGQLYVSSWGEYRVERFTLKPKGASVTAEREIVVQGDNQFRPVDFAIGPDDSLYFTDWVDRSYNVHRKGRIWRLSWRQPAPEVKVPDRSDQENRALRASTELDLDALGSDDPFLHQAAVIGFVNSDSVIDKPLADLTNPRQRLGILEAARKSIITQQRRDQLLEDALQDPDGSVRIYAIRWIADDRITTFRLALEELLTTESSSTQLLMATLAALEWIDTGKVDRNRTAGDSRLLAALDNPAPSTLKAIALKALPPAHQAFKGGLLSSLIKDEKVGSDARLEATRTLAISQQPGANKARMSLVQNNEIPVDLRADLLSGIAPTTEEARSLLIRLAMSENNPLREPAVRILAQNQATQPNAAGKLPQADDIDAWVELLGAAAGNSQSGWRVFFGRHAGRCANCHRFDGRGADIGPDLTSLGRRIGRRRLLQSILQPSQEIAPRYVPWIVSLESGRVFTAMSLGVPGSKEMEQFLTSDGKQFQVDRSEIETRKLTSQSIMPDGLHKQLSVSQLRDLLALLEG